MSNILTNNINARSGNRITIGKAGDTVSIAGTLSYEDVSSVDSVGLITARSGIHVTGAGSSVGIGTDKPEQSLHVRGDIRVKTSRPVVRYKSLNDAHQYFAGADVNDTFDGGYQIGVGHGIGVGAAGTTALCVTSDARIGIGTTVPQGVLHLLASDAKLIIQDSDSSGNSGTPRIQFQDSSGAPAHGEIGYTGTGDSDLSIINKENANIQLHTNNTERLRITSDGDVGIGTNSAALRLHVQDTVSQIIRFSRTAIGAGSLDIDIDGNAVFNSHTNNRSVVFHTQTTERARIDSDGRLLVGATSARANFYNNASGVETRLQVEGTSFTTSSAALIRNSNNASDAELVLAKSRGGSVGSNTVVQSGDSLGAISFQGSDGAEFVEAASITGFVDGTPGSNDMPGRLIFSTTADAGTSPTERLRIHAAGHGEFSSGAVTRVLVTGNESLGGGSQTINDIPSWATKITVIFYDMSLTGSADILVQLRADGNNITSNYTSGCANDTGSVNDTSTSGFIVTNTNSSHLTSGRMVIERVGTASRWVSSSTVVIDGGTPRHGAGRLSTYTGTIDGVRLIDTGSNTFDNGTVTVYAEA